jgi:hypothetical protein
VVERVERGMRRAKFVPSRVGRASDAARAASGALRDALSELEALGLSPLLEDGAVAGNGALRLDDGALLVSASGRRPGEPRWVEVVALDVARFHVHFRSDDAVSEPTSDVALYWAALVERPGPRAALHGHALASEEDAHRLALPISEHAIEFGTPEEHASMLAMLDRWPYPRHRAWIRRDHGFFLAGESLEQLSSLARSLVGRAP